ncbi:MAG: trehalase family glycosidase [Planctomycetota bacterium]
MEAELCDRVHQYIETIIPLIEHPPSGQLPHPYLTPGYGRQYGDRIFCWDNHHMSMRLAIGGRPEHLRHSIDNLLHHQCGDGYVPNVVTRDDGPLCIGPGFHALPFLMQGALMYVKQSSDVSWLRQVFGKLAGYLAYFETDLRAPHGLFRWKMAYMSGIDNDAATTFFLPDAIIPVDINAWVYMEYLAASKLARLLDRREEASGFETKAQALRKAVNEILWLDEESSYAAYNLCEGRNVFHCEHKYAAGAGRFAFQSCSNLIPLYARMANEDQARRMLKGYVLDERHFLSRYGIRSLSRSSDYYNNAVLANPPRFGGHFWLTCSNWQGPVWTPLCYFMFNALLHYGLRNEAEDLADRTLRVLAGALETRGSFSENFHAETGEPLYSEKVASWNILADTMHRQLTEGKWIMDPVFE